MLEANWTLGALFLATGLSSALLTFVLIRMDSWLGLTAFPRQDRWHRRATPNSGGVAIFLSCALAYGIGFRGAYPAIALGAAATFVLGFLDDRAALRPIFKLTAQCVIAALVVHSGVVFPASSWVWANEIFSFLWIVGLTNAFNLIDNMDGLCAGVTILIAGFRVFTLLAVGGHPTDVGMAVAVAAAFAGFLIFNYHPARIFMGDCGSMFAGFALSSLTIASSEANTKMFAAGLFYPALTFTYPIFDVLLVSLLRRLAGRPISVGGRDHSSHRLACLGIGEDRVVWILWGLTGLGSAMGLLARWMPLEVMASAALLVAALSMFGIFLGTLPPYQIPRDSPALASSFRKHIPTLRAGMILLVDVLLGGVALFVVFLTRYELNLTPDRTRTMLLSVLIVMVSHGLVSYLRRTFDFSWQWFGAKDAISLTRTTVEGALLAGIAMFALGASHSLDVLLLYCALCSALGVGLRCSLGVLQSVFQRPDAGRERVGIFGVGAEGRMVARLLRQNGALNATPVVFLDYDRAKEGMRVDGIPVRCCEANLRRLCLQFGLQAIVIAGSYDDERHVGIRRDCLEAGLRLRALEISMRDLGAVPLTASARA